MLTHSHYSFSHVHMLCSSPLILFNNGASSTLPSYLVVVPLPEAQGEVLNALQTPHEIYVVLPPSSSSSLILGTSSFLHLTPHCFTLYSRFAMSQLGVILQESLRAETEARTILGLLTNRMDDVDRGQRRRRSFKERLRFAGMGCCGAAWVFRPVALTFRHAQEQAPETGGGGRTSPLTQQQEDTSPGQDPNPFGPECVRPGTSGSGMNLAAALAAERQLRGTQDAGGEGSSGGDEGSETPWRVSLMRLLEETEDGGGGGDLERVGMGNEWVCCVCMGRKKGAAFIPCGHTFCRVCCRKVWLNRGTCPLCNRSILNILDIF